MRMEFDPESCAVYIRVREGEVEEALDLARPGFGAYICLDYQGNLLGLELLPWASMPKRLVRGCGGTLKLPEHVKNSALFRLASIPPGS
jgi:uncharacterized protein YuzE